ncbi:MAG TPA: O-antigen ligase family protein [Gaiellaceae bacterium]|nr:O-antigen ligase family protein [Gaiellaceae bacterium]
MIGLAHLGGPIAGLALALLLVARTRRDRLAALGFAAFGTAVLGASVAPHHHLLVLCGGLLLAGAVALGLAAVFRSWPWLLPVLALACVPIRIGVHLGSSSSKLLVPLYVVVAGGVVLLAWDLMAGDEQVRELRRVSTPLALFVAWTSISILWTRDVHDGAVELLAFYVPFTLLAICVARLPWQELGLRVLYVELLVMGIAFSVVGFYQYETRDIFQNPKVITANAYAPFFRVNSVFWDPSIYGRFLVVAMLPSLVLLARNRLPRWAPLAAAAALAVMWAGLLISFSQSSFAALLVVVAAAAFLFWRWRALLVIAVAAAVLAGIAVAQPKVRQQLQHHTIHGLNEASSGRASLVAVGIRIAEAHPVRGVGVGGFKQAYAKRTHLKGKEPKKAASHNTAVTVAAETGAPGILLYLWLLVAAFRQAFRRRTTLALIGGIGVAAILCHSLFYNAFFEDPVTWALFGLAAIGAPRQFARVREPVPEVERAQVVA